MIDRLFVCEIHREPMAIIKTSKPAYGIDAPNVLRNLFVFGVLCLLIAAFIPRHLHLGQVDFLPQPMFLGTGTLLVLEGLLFLLYVKFGKFHHRDRMLSLYAWRGDEEVLDACTTSTTARCAVRPCSGSSACSSREAWLSCRTTSTLRSMRGNSVRQV